MLLLRLQLVMVALASCCLPLKVQAAECLPAPSGLLGWWPGEGNANDVASTNNGVLHGGASADAQGVVGTAFRFDGTNSLIQIPNSALLRPSNLTVEAWVQFASLDSAGIGGSPAGEQYIVFRQNSRSNNFEGFALTKTRFDGSDHFSFLVSSDAGMPGGITSTTTINTGAWYHVAGVRGSNFIQLYVNGLLEQQTNIAFPQDYGDFPMCFGSSGQPYWDHQLQAALDEVSLYGRALSPDEIADIYAAGASGKCKPPTITLQPTNQVVLHGNAATFSVTASGTAPLAYHWQKDGAYLADGDRINGATNLTLTISNIQIGDLGDYQAVVSSAYGMALSRCANLAVLPFVIWGIPTGVPPSTLTNAIALATGGETTGNLSLAVKSDGTVSGWGHYYDGNTTHLFTPADIPPTATNVVAIAAGTDHGLARRSDGAVVGIGDDYYGQADVQPGLVPAAGISAGASYSMVLNTNGAPIAWGSLYFVGLPPPGLRNLLSVSAGTYHALGLREDGTVTGWGDNLFGEVGVPPGLSNVVAVAAGGAHSLALRSDGTVSAWGDNSYGESSVPGGLSNVISIANGKFHSLALRSDGTVVGWGRNDEGQAFPPNGLTNVVAIGAGLNQSVALLQTPAAHTAPAIWCQGSTNRVLLIGQTTLLVPSITGSLPMAFQWYLNEAGLSGQTNRWLILPSAQSSQSGAYVLVVSNSAGAVTSAVTSVQIGSSPLVLQQPLSSTNITGGSVQFNGTVSGSEPLAYQWFHNSAALGDDARHFGSATTGLVISNLVSGDAGSYTLRVTSPFGSTTSAVAKLTVYIPPSFTLQPTSKNVLGGNSVFLWVSATGTEPLRFQWVKNGTNLSSATSSSFFIFRATRTNSGSYSVVVTNLGGAITSSLATVKVHVAQRLMTTLQPGGQVALTSQDSDGGFLSTNDLAGFLLMGSSNFYDWQAMSNTLTYTNGYLQFTDSSTSNNGAWFYRVIEFW